jgi:hypothetical protein
VQRLDDVGHRQLQLRRQALAVDRVGPEGRRRLAVDQREQDHPSVVAGLPRQGGDHRADRHRPGQGGAAGQHPDRHRCGAGPVAGHVHAGGLRAQDLFHAGRQEGVEEQRRLEGVGGVRVHDGPGGAGVDGRGVRVGRGHPTIVRGGLPGAAPSASEPRSPEGASPDGPAESAAGLRRRAQQSPPLGCGWTAGSWLGRQTAPGRDAAGLSCGRSAAPGAGTGPLLVGREGVPHHLPSRSAAVSRGTQGRGRLSAWTRPCRALFSPPRKVPSQVKRRMTARSCWHGCAGTGRRCSTGCGPPTATGRPSWRSGSPGSRSTASCRRPADLRLLDLERHVDPDWFQSPRMLGYACYAERFAGDLPAVGGAGPVPRRARA